MFQRPGVPGLGIARVVAVSIAALLLPGAIATGSRAEQKAEAPSQPMIGAAAPGFDLKTVSGDALRLADLRGRYVVIHFGASW